MRGHAPLTPIFESFFFLQRVLNPVLLHGASPNRCLHRFRDADLRRRCLLAVSARGPIVYSVLNFLPAFLKSSFSLVCKPYHIHCPIFTNAGTEGHEEAGGYICHRTDTGTHCPVLLPAMMISSLPGKRILIQEERRSMSFREICHCLHAAEAAGTG